APHDAGGQAGAAPPPLRAELPILRADPVVQQDARPAPGRGKHHHPRPLPGPPGERRHGHGAAQVRGADRPPPGFEPQAAGHEHGVEDGAGRADIRKRARRPGVLGPAAGVGGRRPPRERRVRDRSRALLLARARPGSRLRRRVARPSHRHRGEIGSSRRFAPGTRRLRLDLRRVPPAPRGRRRHRCRGVPLLARLQVAAMTQFNESIVEEAALTWLEGLGWATLPGSVIAPDAPGAERRDFGDVVLEHRLRSALARLNPGLPQEALEDAYRKVTRPEGADLIQRNRGVHRMLVNGVTVEYRAADGTIRGAQVRVIDFDDPAANDWLAVNQFAVVENRRTRRPDIVLFVNGLPLADLELQNRADGGARIGAAYPRLQTYQAEIPSPFASNAALVVSDGVEARIGVLGAGREWFKPWRTVDGTELAGETEPQLRVLIQGVFEHRRFLDLVRDFIVFEDDDGRITKKMAGYHQFHAVQVAVRETLRAAELGAGHGAHPELEFVRPRPEERYRTCVPFVPLQAAAGYFGDPRSLPDEDELEWVAVRTHRKLRPG